METQDRKIALKEGQKYSLCTCGASKSIPFCDNSHRELNVNKDLKEEDGACFKSLKINPEKDITLNVSSKNWNQK